MNLSECNARYRLVKQLVNSTEFRLVANYVYIPLHMNGHIPESYADEIKDTYQKTLDIVRCIYGVERINPEAEHEAKNVDDARVTVTGIVLIKAEGIPLCAIHYRYIRRDLEKFNEKTGDIISAARSCNFYDIRFDMTLQDLSSGDGKVPWKGKFHED